MAVWNRRRGLRQRGAGCTLAGRVWHVYFAGRGRRNAHTRRGHSHRSIARPRGCGPRGVPGQKASFTGVTSERPINGFRATVTFKIGLGGRTVRSFVFQTLGCFGTGAFPVGVDPYAETSWHVTSIPIGATGVFAAKVVPTTTTPDAGKMTATISGTFTARARSPGRSSCADQSARRVRAADGAVHRRLELPRLELTLPSYVRCPACRGPLGAGLVCTACGRRYETEDGIPRLLDPTAPGLDAKLRELEAWPVLAREQGWYEADDRIDAALPYLNRDLGWEDRAWGATEHGFQLLLDRYVRPGDRVLEVGRGEELGVTAPRASRLRVRRLRPRRRPFDRPRPRPLLRGARRALPSNT